MNMVVTNQDNGSAPLFDNVYKPVTYVVSAAAVAAGVLQSGLVLALNTSTGNAEDYVSGGPNGTGVQSMVVANDITLPAGTVATDELSISPIVGGQVRLERLYTAAADTIDEVFQLGLRDYGITAISVDDVSKLDNQ